MSKLLQSLTLAMPVVAVMLLPWGDIEGRFFPVMGDLTIGNPVPFPPPDYRSKWEGDAQKLRNCSWVRTEWYLGDRGGNRVRVNFEYTDPPKLRETGNLHWNGMLISLDIGSVQSASHSDVIHKCHGLWETRTPWFR